MWSSCISIHLGYNNLCFWADEAESDAFFRVTLPFAVAGLFLATGCRFSFVVLPVRTTPVRPMACDEQGSSWSKYNKENASLLVSTHEKKMNGQTCAMTALMCMHDSYTSKQETCRTCSNINVLCYRIVIWVFSKKKKRNAIPLIKFEMENCTDNSSTVREIIVIVLSKPILCGRRVPLTDQSSVY